MKQSGIKVYLIFPFNLWLINSHENLYKLYMKIGIQTWGSNGDIRPMMAIYAGQKMTE